MINTVEECIETFNKPPQNLPNSWWQLPNVQEAHRVMARQFIANAPPYPDKYAERGIVICAGGQRYFTCAYVCTRILRMLGCQLPIQFWHLAGEIDKNLSDLVAPYDVTCHDASEIEPQPRILHGWELKPFAIIHSSFQEVLLLDADNVAVNDPSFLFDCKVYNDTGAIFWPDFGKLDAKREIWNVFETKYEDYPDQHEFESGQIVVDKKRHWRELLLTMWMNEHSDYFYKFIHGDKCTFEMAWKRLKSPFHLVQHDITRLTSTMCQHNPVDNEILFQHRNLDKWSLDTKNKTISRFKYEKECKEFLQQLKDRWYNKNTKLLKEIPGKYTYHRIGHDKREMELLTNGIIGQGNAHCEKYWRVEHNSLIIAGEGFGQTCSLRYGEGSWKGKWLRFEKMPIEMIKIK